MAFNVFGLDDNRYSDYESIIREFSNPYENPCEHQDISDVDMDYLRPTIINATNLDNARKKYVYNVFIPLIKEHFEEETIYTFATISFLVSDFTDKEELIKKYGDIDGNILYSIYSDWHNAVENDNYDLINNNTNKPLIEKLNKCNGFGFEADKNGNITISSPKWKHLSDFLWEDYDFSDDSIGIYDNRIKDISEKSLCNLIYDYVHFDICIIEAIKEI